MRVLYVATDLRDADILQQEVRKAAPKLVFEVCAGAAEARKKADRSLGYDAMLVDSGVAESEQLLLIQHVRSKQIPLPIALLSHQTVGPSSALVSAADECITRGPRLGERIGSGLRMAIERYRVLATTLRDNDRLMRSEARLRLIIEALPAGVVLVDQAGKILAMNLAGSKLVGTTGPSDVIGRELYSLADGKGAQQLRELVGQALGGERARVEFTCHGADGMIRRLGVNALCIQRDETIGHGLVLGVVAAAPVDVRVVDAAVEFAIGEDTSALTPERAGLDEALDAARADVDRLERDAHTERGRVQQPLEARVAALVQRAGELESLLASRSSELDGLANDLGAARVEQDQTRDQLRRESEARARIESELQARQAGNDQREHELQGLLSRKSFELDSLAGQLAVAEVDATEARDLLTCELEARTRVETGLKAQLADLQSQLVTLGQRASELDGLLAARSPQLEGLRGALAAARFEGRPDARDQTGEGETRARV